MRLAWSQRRAHIDAEALERTQQPGVPGGRWPSAAHGGKADQGAHLARGHTDAERRQHVLYDITGGIFGPPSP